MGFLVQPSESRSLCAVAVLTLHAYSFQAYTTCTVILHSVAQKQLHDFEPSSWQDDMVRAADCLSVLEYCASLDPVAARFHEQLRGFIRRLREQGQIILEARSQQGVNTQSQFQSSTPHTSIGSTGCSPVDQHEGKLTYLLDIPANSDPDRVDLSLQLLGILCRPFRGPNNEQGVEKAVNEAWGTDPARYETGLMVARLDWDFGGSEPFHWDFSSVSPGVTAQSDGIESSPTPSPPSVKHGPTTSSAALHQVDGLLPRRPEVYSDLLPRG